MESNVMAAQPSALALREREHGGEQQQPENQAPHKDGKNAGVERSSMRGSIERLASMAVVALVALVQLLWGAVLAYVAYSAIVGLPL
jgi:hypothetical protein